MKILVKLLLLVFLGLSGFCVSGQVKAPGQVHVQPDVLHVIYDSATGRYGYANSRGKAVIPFGKYDACYTETFANFAIVMLKGKGIVGIDRKEHVLFNVHIYDNGPDYVSEGLFRIVKDGKYGYANMRGEIVIAPQYDGAFPFSHGVAKVGKGCSVQTFGEHSTWVGGTWFTIDKKGRRK